MSPMFGQIMCKIQMGSLDEAEQQLEFINEIVDQQGKTSEQTFLEAIIEWRRRMNQDQAITYLNQTLNLHITNTKAYSGNLSFYIHLNADFLI